MIHEEAYTECPFLLSSIVQPNYLLLLWTNILIQVGVDKHTFPYAIYIYIYRYIAFIETLIIAVMIDCFRHYL